MWKPIFCAILVLAVYANPQTPQIHIDEVGLRGYYSTSLATRLKLHVDPAGAAAHPLQVRIEVGKKSRYPTRADNFTINFDPRGPHELELPLFVYTYNNAVTLEFDDPGSGQRRSVEAGEAAYIRVDLLDESERRIIASDTMEPVHNEASSLIAIVCNDKTVCNTAQEQIQFGGSQEERNQKNNFFKFVILNDGELPPEWWAYGQVTAIVVALPMHGLPEQKRSALEQYARQGGTLILLEKQIDDDTFLSSYRKGAITQKIIPLGEGGLLRIADLQGGKLQDLFSGANLQKISSETIQWHVPTRGAELGPSIRSRSGSLFVAHFSFPRLFWIVTWLVSYMVIVGFVNFTVLRGMRRREWAWITTPFLAVFYAGVIYVVSDFNRPRKFTIDEVALLTLDDRSSMAVEEMQVRVSSPRVQQTTLVSPTSAILMPPSSGQRPQAIINLEDREEWEPGWNVASAKQQTVDLPLLRWDFRDLNFTDFVQLPGTIHWDGAGHIENRSGYSFDDAVYIDKNSTVFLLGPVAAGSKIDLGKSRWQSGAEFGRSLRQTLGASERDREAAPPGLKALLEPEMCDCPRDQEYFVGLSREKPPWEAELEGIVPDRNHLVIMVVKLDRQHD